MAANKHLKDSPLPTFKAHPLLGNVPSMVRNSLEHFHVASKKLGRTFENPILGYRVIATSDPEFIRHVMVINQKNYGRTKAVEMVKLALGNGLITSDGEFWRNQRRLIQPAFHKKNLQLLFEQMGKQVHQFVKKLQKKDGQQVNMHKEFTNITAEVVLKAMFSDGTSEDMNEVYHEMTKGQKYISDRIRNPIGKPLFYLNGRTRKFNKGKVFLDNIILTLIENRRKAEASYSDLLQMLMDATYEGNNDQMDDQQLLDEMFTIFAAGHETSSNALTWILYLLNDHPQIVAKIKAEYEPIVGDRLPTYEELRSLTYLRQVIDEGMRVFPPVWQTGRLAWKDDEFNGIPIRKGDPIFINIYNLHHDPELYPNPDAFDPDRFEADKVKARPKLAHMPFGAGPRLCIGNMFAIMEMQLILVGLLQHLSFKTVPNQKIEMDAMITVAPKYGMCMEVENNSRI